MKRIGIGIAGLAVGLVGMVSGNDIAWAQGASGIEEIIVTARKREESLQRVPVAVTAFGANELEGQTVVSLVDVDLLVPNFEASRDNLNVRGIKTNNIRSTSDPGVGLYLDGVYIARQNAVELPLTGIERVEVLRGPQGTLFGRNTTGGAVNITTKRPSYEGFSGLANVFFGNYVRNDYTAEVNVPLIQDQLALRASFESNNRGGYGDSVVTGLASSELVGQEIGAEETQSFYGTLLWEPTEDLDVILRGDWRQRRDDGSSAQNLIAFTSLAEAFATGNTAALGSYGVLGGLGTSPAAFLIPRDDLTFDIFSNEHEFEDTDQYGASVTLEYAVNEDVTAKFIAAKRWLQRHDSQELDGTPARILQAELIVDNETFSSELQLFGTKNLFGFDTDWFGGAFFFTEENKDDSASTSLEGLNPRNPGFSSGVSNSQSVAGFAQLNIHLVENGNPGLQGLTLNLGGRYTRDTKELVSRNSRGAFPCGIGTPASFGALCADGGFSAIALSGGSVIFQQDKSQFKSRVGFDRVGFDQSSIWSACSLEGTSGPAILDNPGECQATFKDKFDGFSWNFGLDWQVFDSSGRSLMIYVLNSRGFRSGGQNFSTVIPDNSFDPETVTNYEVGIKSDWFGGNLRANVNAFTMDYKDIQVSAIVNTPNGLATIISNAATATLKGVEGEVIANPFPSALPGLQVRGSVGYIDAGYDDFVDQQPTNPALPFDAVTNPLVDNDRSDEPFTGTPKWSYSLTGIYTHPLSFGDVTLRADYSWRSTVHNNVQFKDTSLTSDKSRGLVNGRAALTIADSNLELALWCRNCADKEYITGGLSLANSLGPIMVSPGIPRTYGGEVTWRFGT